MLFTAILLQLPKKVDETLYEQYINALCQEITMYQALFPDICIDTIYFGGGTPSNFATKFNYTNIKYCKGKFYFKF